MQKMKELIDRLTAASEAYYKDDKPIMTDKEYDDLCDELARLEAETGVVMAGSPNHKVQGYLLDDFKKVQHSKPMLSADKTKDISVIERFVSHGDWYASFKLDGCTLVLKYADGKFVQGITRGNGMVGEDVTEACRFIGNIPMQIPMKEDLEVRGECVVSWDEFTRINEISDAKFSHPRNLASGTLRQLDLGIVKRRKLSFVLFEVVTDIGIDSKWECLHEMEVLGFETVWRLHMDTAQQAAEVMQKTRYKYPCDGVIFELDSRKKSMALGATEHHENCRMALKWQDELYETTLRDVEWFTSKTGLINPVAVFDAVDLDGAMTTRATLHNVSYIKDLKLGIGDTIRVYRANMVIPKIHDNLTQSDTYQIPRKCPMCGGEAEIVKQNITEVLMCTNEYCPGKLLGVWKVFASKSGMDIDGLSEQTLDRLLSLGYIDGVFANLYHLKDHRKELYNLGGFGKKSVDKLLQAIEDSKETDLKHFITAFSIPNIGEGQAKLLASKFLTFENFMAACDNDYDFSQIAGIGEVINRSIHDWWFHNHMLMIDLAQIVHFKDEDFMNKPTGYFPLLDKTFVITGSVNHFKNRDELKAKIESLGGKVSGAVSKSTSFLINNDKNSGSAKNKKAKELLVEIITEEEFLKMIGE